MTLLILPNLLGEVENPHLILPPAVFQAAARITGLFAESEKGARKFIRLIGASQSLPIILINEHSKPQDVKEALSELSKGGIWGLISDAGLPLIADPGSSLVFGARKAGIAIEATMGPSAILLSLLLTGFPANRFSFHGYLPIEEPLRQKALIALELKSQREGSTEVFIETPYRNDAMIESALKALQPSTWLATVANITLPNQSVNCMKVEEWRKKRPSLHKVPATFLIYAKTIVDV